MPKLACLLFLFFVIFASSSRAEPAAWRVEGENGTLTVFGTFHSLPQGAEWFSEDLKQEFEAARLLVLETVNTQASDDYLGHLLRQPGVATGKKPLIEVIGGGNYGELLERLRPHGYSEEDIKFVRPWYAITLLGKAGGDEMGLDFSRGPEQTLTRMAKNEGKEILGLESPAQQVRFYSELSREVETAWLKSILSRDDETGSRSESLYQFWTAGDLEAIRDRIVETYMEIPPLYEVFIKQRNQNWAEQLSHLLEEGGRIFVAVGAGHMAGPDNVLKLLEKRGFSLTRIQ